MKNAVGKTQSLYYRTLICYFQLTTDADGVPHLKKIKNGEPTGELIPMNTKISWTLEGVKRWENSSYIAFCLKHSVDIVAGTKLYPIISSLPFSIDNCFVRYPDRYKAKGLPDPRPLLPRRTTQWCTGVKHTLFEDNPDHVGYVSVRYKAEKGKVLTATTKRYTKYEYHNTDYDTFLKMTENMMTRVLLFAQYHDETHRLNFAMFQGKPYIYNPQQRSQIEQALYFGDKQELLNAHTYKPDGLQMPLTPLDTENLDLKTLMG